VVFEKRLGPHKAPFPRVFFASVESATAGCRVFAGWRVKCPLATSYTGGCHSNHSRFPFEHGDHKKKRLLGPPFVERAPISGT